jgi:hypothetical protein
MKLESSPEEFLQRLQEQLTPAPSYKPLRDALVGTVAPQSIQIRRVRAFVRNDLAPRFSGRLSPDRRFLSGTFEAPTWARRFLLIWLAGAGFFAVMMLVPDFRGQQDQAWAPAIPVLMGALGALLPRLGWFFGRGDVVRIKDALAHAAREDQT